MLGIQKRPFVPERLAQLPVHVELVLQPQRPRHEERLEPPGGDTKVGLEDSLKLEKRLVVEANVGEMPGLYPAGTQTILDRLSGEARVALLPGEAFLLGRSHDLAVLHETGSTVMVEGRETQYVTRCHGERSGNASAGHWVSVCSSKSWASAW